MLIASFWQNEPKVSSDPQAVAAILLSSRAETTPIRDYIHVTDLANALVLALQAIEGGMLSSAYNLGNCRGFSVREVVAAVERVTGLAVPVILGKRPIGDPAALVSDASKARETFDWQPKIPDTDEIVRTAWAWHKRSPTVRSK